MEGIGIEGAVIALRGAKRDVDVDGRSGFIFQIPAQPGSLLRYLRKKTLR